VRTLPLQVHHANAPTAGAPSAGAPTDEGIHDGAAAEGGQNGGTGGRNGGSAPVRPADRSTGKASYRNALHHFHEKHTQTYKEARAEPKAFSQEQTERGCPVLMRFVR